MIQIVMAVVAALVVLYYRIHIHPELFPMAYCRKRKKLRLSNGTAVLLVEPALDVSKALINAIYASEGFRAPSLEELSMLRSEYYRDLPVDYRILVMEESFGWTLDVHFALGSPFMRSCSIRKAYASVYDKERLLIAVVKKKARAHGDTAVAVA